MTPMAVDGHRSCPHPSRLLTESYLVQTDLEGAKDRLLSYASPLPGSASRAATALRGFKQYWHRGSAADANDLRVEGPTEHVDQYTRIRPVRPGVHFQGTIRFENLLPLELGVLLAALELPADCRHRVGMGKPLGMGSVRLDAEIALFDAGVRYRSLRAGGWLGPEAMERKATEARQAFRTQIVGHYNERVAAVRLPETADIWDIPRLAVLRTLLDWEHRPARADTAYLRDPRGQDLKEFRERRVLPTPVAVPRPVEPTAGSPGSCRPAGESEPDASAAITSSPVLQALQVLLQDQARSQRARLDAIETTLLEQLASLDAALQRQAWRMIDAVITSNHKTRERLKAIDRRLGGGPT